MDTNIALEKAVTFLIDSRNKDHLWSDFNLPTGESDEWVTGYVGTIMSGIGNSIAFPLLKRLGKNMDARFFFLAMVGV
ncbi:MAG: hypothetical protein ACOYNU_14235 [Bacteroidales bacterium]